MAHGKSLEHVAPERGWFSPCPPYSVERDRTLRGKARIQARKAANRASKK